MSSKTASQYTGESVFVTGAYGMVGSWLVGALLEQGAEVCVLCLDPERAKGSRLVLEGLQEHCNVFAGDLREPGTLTRAVEVSSASSVFHLAAQTTTGNAYRSPLETFDTNIRGTWQLLDECRTSEVQRVIVSASDKAYGDHKQLPYKETQALQPRFPYEVSKACGDLLGRSYWHSYGLPVAVTRFANIYGGGDRNTSRLVPGTVAALLRDQNPVIRSDGSPQRDYLHVDDAVAAYLAIWEALQDAPEQTCGEAFNAGTGKPTSVLEVVTMLCALSGSDLHPDVVGVSEPAAAPDCEYVDSQKLQNLTGWQPKVALEAGLRQTIDWYRDHPAVLS